MTNKEKDKKQKQILLRLSTSLWQELATWAADDFRSINGQIEYLLTDCVRQRKKGREQSALKSGPAAKDSGMD